MWNIDLPNWITAVATVATAIIAYLGFRQTLAKPVIELNSLRWDTHPELPRFIKLNVTLRNPMLASIVVESVRIKRPRKATFAKRKSNLPYENKLETTGLQELKTDWTAAAAGEWHDAALSPSMASVRADVLNVTIYVVPPADWTDGLVEVTFRISSNASTTLVKRIVTRRHINAEPIRIIADTASNHD